MVHRNWKYRWSLLLLIIVIVVPQIFATAHADWPVILTDDSNTVLNLTKPENAIDLLECGIWVEQHDGDFNLRNIGGKDIRIPRLAVKSIQDQSVVDIAVDAKLLGLQLRMINVVLRKQGEELHWNAGTWPQGMQEKRGSPYYYSQQITFLIEGNQQQMTDVISKAMVTNRELVNFKLNIYPSKESYQHPVLELVAFKELSEGIGAPLLHWALLARGISKNVNPPFFEVPLNGETGLIPAGSTHRRPSNNLLKKIGETRPIRTQLTYMCLIDEVPNLDPQQ